MKENSFQKELKFPRIFKKLKLVSDSLQQTSPLQDTPSSFSSENPLNSDFFSNEIETLELSSERNKNGLELEPLEHSRSLDATTSNVPDLKGYSKTQELKLVKIGFASPQQIQAWAEKVLPNKKVFGEVLNANTLHYKTFKPHKGGLFCERIFGPLKDFECACGIKQKPFENDTYVQNLLNGKTRTRVFCPTCDVEYTWSIIRRYQLGYIRFASPIVHLWYLKTNPSYLSLILDIRKKDLESIVYCMQTITLEYYWKPMHSLQLNLTPQNLALSYKNLLALNSNGKESGFKTRSSKKRFKHIEQKRRNLKVGRSILPFLSSSTQKGPPSDNAPLELKIQYLEKSFQLSTDEINPKQFAKLSQLQHQFTQKVSDQKLSKTILKLNNKFVGNLYEKTYKALTNATGNSLSKKRTAFVLKKGTDSSLVLHNKLSFFFLLKSYLRKKTMFKNALKIQNDRNLRLKCRLFYWNKTQNFFSKTSSPSFTKRGFYSQKNFFSYMLNDFFRYDFTSFYKKSIFRHSSEILVTSAPFLFGNGVSSIDFDSKNNTQNKNLRRLFILVFFLFLENYRRSLKKTFVIKEKCLDPFLAKIQRYFVAETKTQENEKTKVILWDGFKSKRFMKEFQNLSKNDEIEDFLKLVNNEKSMFSTWAKAFYKSSQSKNKASYFQSRNSKKSVLLFKLQKKNLSNRVSLPEVSTHFDWKRSENQASTSKKHQTLEFVKNLKPKQKSFTVLSKSHSYKTLFLNLQTLKTNVRNRMSLKKEKVLKAFVPTNNIYTVSYLNEWQTEKDWKYFLYYMTAPIEISDVPMFCYQKRLNLENNFQYNSNALPVLGAHLLQKLLIQYEGPELKKMTKQYQNVLPKLNRYIRSQKQIAMKKKDVLRIQKLLQKRDQILRRLKLLRKLFKKNTKTTSIVLKNLPVLPPDLRPILKMQNQVAASDLNRFYQRILYRNDRLKKFLRANASFQISEPGFEMKYAQRLLQEAVDNLIQNGKGNVKPETNSRGQPLKSLSEILKGKQGRFRQYLLGKRVDYSGRSVIVVGPTLKIYECGLPFEMAIELFLPFVIKKIFQYNLARTVIGAKTILKTQPKITWDLLEEVMKSHPILLNRAPTLHRLGIQAFQPKLIEGRAILLHPLVCPAFNADFDGDQMAVHVPITVEARTEAWKLMFARNHLVSPATGESMLLPSQDMVLGCYYLTTETVQHKRFHSGRPFYSGTGFYFSNFYQVLQAYLQEKIHLQTPIWMRWVGLLQMDQKASLPLEIQIRNTGTWTEFRPKLQKRILKSGISENCFVRTTAGRILFNVLISSTLESK